ncbi:hypothetical protein QT995_13950 [Microcoleus sp. S36b_A3]|uniref:hypothetical protein n=1 Tax=unclassified Microcoleus TaxID=2642155 RepID=UPI002FD3EA5B
MCSNTKLIECHNWQFSKIIDFCLNYIDLILSFPPPSQVGKYIDSTVADAIGRSGKISIFWRQQLRSVYWGIQDLRFEIDFTDAIWDLEQKSTI